MPRNRRERGRNVILTGQDHLAQECRGRPTRERAESSGTLLALPAPWVEPVDVSNAIVFLASDEARYVTGINLPVDGGSAAT